MCCLRGGEWCGRPLFQASTSPSDILHSSFKIFNHEVKEPRQVQRTLAKICFGISFLEKINKKETIIENKWIPNSYCSSCRVQRSFPSLNCESGKPDHDSNCQVSADRSIARCSGVANFSVTTVLCSVMWRFRRFWDLRTSEQWPHFIYFKSNILVYFLSDKCMFCTNYYEGLNSASSGSLHCGPMQST